jgi:hypothetical protein
MRHDQDKDAKRIRIRMRCCDATIAALGLTVVLGGLFREEITWFFAAN